METAVYDPSAPVPALSPENEAKLRERRAVLLALPSARRPRDRAQRVEQFELFLIEAIFAAAVRDPLRTQADGWTVVSRRNSQVPFCHQGSPQYQGLQNEFAEAVASLHAALSS